MGDTVMAMVSCRDSAGFSGVAAIMTGGKVVISSVELGKTFRTAP
jgi:hypothetical protein